MSHDVVERTATTAELTFLQERLDNAPTTGYRWKQGAESALVFWASSLLGLCVIWLALAWLGQKLFEVDYGLRSPAALWIWSIAIPLCAVLGVVSSIRWLQGWRDYRPLLRSDISNALVAEEHYVFSESKRFQEPEHGGFLYFLRIDKDRSLVLFDHESQDLGVQGDDPLKSSFSPQSRLIMVRAPHSRFVISTTFSGESLATGDPLPLELDPSEWPEQETLCDIPWAELETKFGPALEK